MNKCDISSGSRHHGPFLSLRDSAANPTVLNEWQGSSVEADSGNLINACELMKWVRKYFTVPQVIHP